MRPSSSNLSLSLTPKRLGYWMSPNKYKRLRFSEVEEALQKRNIEVVRVELTTQVDEDFDGFLHKLSDVIPLADYGDLQAKSVLSNFEQYLKDHPNTVVIDPLSSIRVVIDRWRAYCSIQNCDFETKETVFVPTFILVESLQCDILDLMLRSKVHFPVVCKPIIGDGAPVAHKMTLVFNEKGFTECQFPCVIQTFVNHNAILYKVYAIGENFYVTERSSIRNVSSAEDVGPIHFHTEDISEGNSQHELVRQVPSDTDVVPKPSEEVLKKIIQRVHKDLKIGLFGIDVVLERSSGHYAIIDVNVFPRYSGMPDFANVIAGYIRKQLDIVPLCLACQIL